jgi:hypothetical protein
VKLADLNAERAAREKAEEDAKSKATEHERKARGK